MLDGKEKKIIQLRLWFIVSGVLWWITTLVPLTSSYSLISMFRVLESGWDKFLYGIPFFNGLLMIFFGILILPLLNSRKLLIYLILILDLNLTTLFLSQILQQHSPYLWNQPAIYLVIAAFVLFLGNFLAFLMINSHSSQEGDSELI